jgi:hypothetical protein
MIKPIKPKIEEITYAQVARALQCSPRHARRLIQKHGVKPIIRGHRTVRFPADKIFSLTIRLGVLTNGRKHSNGHTFTNGSAR